MLDIALARKNKINLTDYDYKKDLNNRLLLSTLSEIELSTLDEIIYSSLKTSVSKLLKNIECDKSKLLLILDILKKTDLLQVEGDIVNIDKKLRNYFEFEYQRFEDCKIDLVFISRLLQKLPIHVLPVWYTLPRSSNNIFQSIIDKYLVTPSVFKRYLNNIEFDDPIFSNILQEVFSSDNLEILSADLQKKFNLDRETYLEHILYLEFNLVCFVSYKKVGDTFVEVISPFHEYKNYLLHLKNTKAKTIADTSALIKKRNTETGFVEDLTSVLIMAKKPISKTQIEKNLTKELNIKDPDIIVSKAYLENVITKLLQINFLEEKNSLLVTSKISAKWLEMESDNKALHFFHFPLNRMGITISEKALREAEKSISRAVDLGWVYFDDFIKGIVSAITEAHQVRLTSIGKGYKYSLPTYTPSEGELVKQVIFERLFEAGLVMIGSLKGKDCFCVTKLGKLLFAISD